MSIILDNIFDLREAPDLFDRACARVDSDTGAVTISVADLIDRVRAGGDGALIELTAQFDGVELSRDEIVADADELERAWKRTPVEIRDALEFAVDRIARYHELDEAPHTFDRDGVSITELVVPVDRAGIYVPGGRASYPSTVLMTAIPARAAGVADIAIAVPPAPDGSVPELTAAAAHLVGVDTVYRIGGAQAIAALAYGTESVGRVDVIAGPGNAYVAEAKVQVSRDVGIESIAGPSELVVIADSGAPVDALAYDLVAQAEHGPGGLVVLATSSDELADAVVDAVDRIVAESPRRSDIEATFAAGGRIVLCEDVAQAIAVANRLAPEHLQLMVSDPAELVPAIKNAGAIFCGYDTPVTLGDYVAGPSHVLPTGGSARFASALRPSDFTKSVHVVTATPSGLRTIGPAAARLAEAEGLPAHAQAVRSRLDSAL